ncbi:MAG: hypothetical protein AAF108_00170 [Planctomycetota bacterium]
MKLSERLASADRFQKSRGFKIGASIVVGVATLGLVVAVLLTGLSDDAGGTMPAAALPDFAPLAEQGVSPEQIELLRENAASAGRARDLLDGLREQSGGVLGLVLGIVVGGAVLTLAAWLGLLLTFTGIAGAVAVVAGPLWFFPETRDWARFAAGLSLLGVMFTTIFRTLRLAFELPGPVFAVARNVLAEAVRLRLSVVFIVVVLIGLAALPASLDPDSPLRYRVQSFLQYGSGGTFWIIALLTVTFGVATVSFEQRDRVIWQTMTKPVAAWEYVLGKWLGVSALAAALLAVNASGVFLFTEYLRQLPALGEREAFVSQGEANEISEDRLILETQVLSARAKIENVYEDVPVDEIREEASRRAAEQAQRDPTLTTEAAIDRRARELAAEIGEQLTKQVVAFQRVIEPGAARVFRFPGVGERATADGPVVLRYRVDSGSNAPDVTYRMSASVAGYPYVVRPIALGVTHTLPIAPIIVTSAGVVTLDDPLFEELAEAIRSGLALGRYVTVQEMVDDDGALSVQLVNGDVTMRRPNPEFASVPAGGMSVSVGVGSYRANFLRVMGVLWLKLAFLAMLAVTAATFLSFPIALMIAGGAFLLAEATPFIGDALENFGTAERDGTVILHKVVAGQVASAAHWVFQTYGELRPTKRLVTGEMLEWSGVARAVAVLGVWTAVLGGAAVVIFRRRELATYSGR